MVRKQPTDQTVEEPERFLTTGEVARTFGVSGTSVINWIKTDGLVATRGSQAKRPRWMLKPADVEAYGKRPGSHGHRRKMGKVSAALVDEAADEGSNQLHGQSVTAADETTHKAEAAPPSWVIDLIYPILDELKAIHVDLSRPSEPSAAEPNDRPAHPAWSQAEVAAVLQESRGHVFASEQLKDNAAVELRRAYEVLDSYLASTAQPADISQMPVSRERGT